MQQPDWWGNFAHVSKFVQESYPRRVLHLALGEALKNCGGIIKTVAEVTQRVQGHGFLKNYIGGGVFGKKSVQISPALIVYEACWQDLTFLSAFQSAYFCATVTTSLWGNLILENQVKKQKSKLVSCLMQRRQESSCGNSVKKHSYFFSVTVLE